VNQLADVPEEQVRQCADRWGISLEYFDTSNAAHRTSTDTCRALLEAMGAGSNEPAAGDVRIVFAGQSVANDKPGTLILEDGTTVPVSDSLPADLPIGYHHLQEKQGGDVTLVIVRPDHCSPTDEMRTWGWAVQLYAARSRASWGIGDLSDLSHLANWSSQLGAGVVFINPLNAVAPVTPQERSPYYPSSRRFLNPIYLDVSKVPGAESAKFDLDRIGAMARQLNTNRHIDRDTVFRLKNEALATLWNKFEHDEQFEQFCTTRGSSLREFAIYCVMAETFGGDWRTWDADYQDPKRPAVDRFASQRLDRVRFHMWLQWLVDQQLSSASDALPLVNDLPIGSDPGGADAWAWQDVLARGATVGAPPDDFNTQGQNWQLPPFIPHRLRAADYRPFREILRAALRHADGLRIDHVMGLFRLFWIPSGFGPQDGAYVRYRADELLAILALESHRAGTWIAGEDLGTVEMHVRDQLAQNAILTYRIMWFEDNHPHNYPQNSLAALTTHDLPTVAGLWSGYDFDAQKRLGIRDDDSGHQAMRGRLQRHAQLPDDAQNETAIKRAHQLLSESPSSVVVANLDDALAVPERPNMPGTLDEWPNWSQALPIPLEDVMQDPLVAEVASVLAPRRASE
jgi:4-alpha-glucanotransferase